MLIKSVHGHCLLFTFVILQNWRKMGRVKSTPITKQAEQFRGFAT